jgi:hypothetical protein
MAGDVLQGDAQRVPLCAAIASSAADSGTRFSRGGRFNRTEIQSGRMAIIVVGRGVPDPRRASPKRSGKPGLFGSDLP